MRTRAVVGVLGAVFMGYLGLAAALPPIDDELYYWCWAKDLQWSYYDHPGMTAWMIALSTRIFGDTVLGVRFPACVCTVGVLAVLFALTRRKSILWGVAASPMFTFGAIIITPDTPLLFFWSLYLFWLVQLHRRVARGVPAWFWVVGGVLLGCGILGKYTCALAIPCGLASLLLLGWPVLRRLLAGYVLHLAAGFVTSCPILIHNIRHDFQPILYQWEHAMSDNDPGFKPLGEFIGVQILLFGTLPWVIIPWVVKNARMLMADPTLRVCVCLAYLPLMFFTFKSTRGPLEGNWALVSFLGFWPIAGKYLDSVIHSRFWRWNTRLTFGIPAGCVILLAIHLTFVIPWIPPEKDRVSRMKAFDAYIRQVSEAIRARDPVNPVYVTHYQWVAMLRFRGVNAHQFAELAPRPSHFTQRPDPPGQSPVWYFFSDFPLPEKYAHDLKTVEKVDTLDFMMRGERLTAFDLYRCVRSDSAP